MWYNIHTHTLQGRARLRGSRRPTERRPSSSESSVAERMTMTEASER